MTPFVVPGDLEDAFDLLVYGGTMVPVRLDKDHDRGISP